MESITDERYDTSGSTTAPTDFPRAGEMTTQGDYVSIPQDVDPPPSASEQPGAIMEQDERYQESLVPPERLSNGNSPVSSPVSQSERDSKAQIAHAAPRLSSHTPEQERRDANAFAHSKVISVWWKELLASVVAVGSLIAILTTLHHFRGKPLPQWPRYISLNALLSIYMVLLRASIAVILAGGLAYQKWRWFMTERPLYDIALYDEGTRGVIGAAALIRRLHIRHWLSSLGCLLTITTIFVDPFAQQVIRYEECRVKDPEGFAELPRTNVFEGSGLDSFYQVGVSSGVQNSVTDGIVAPGVPIAAHCSSGNCTFPRFDTLGFCSSCQDISDEVHFKYGYINTSLPASYNNTRKTVTSYIPGWYELEVVWAEDQGSAVATVGQLFSSNIAVIGGSPGRYPGAIQLIIGMPALPNDGRPGPLNPSTGVAPTHCNGSDAKDTWRCKGYGAANCELRPCIRTYEASVQDGKLREDLVSVHGADPPAGDVYDPKIFGYHTEDGGLGDYRRVATINTTCLTARDRQALRKAGYDIPHTGDVWMPFNLTYHASLNMVDPNATDRSEFSEPMIQHGCVYTMGAIAFQLPGVFYGNLSADWNLGTGVADTISGSPILQIAYNWGNFSFERTESIFKNISDALTNYVRLNPNDTNPVSNSRLSLPVTGTALYTKTCFSIQWEWLILPSLLVLLCLVFLAGTLVTTTPLPDTVRRWKSSPLPLVYRCLAFDGDDDRLAQGNVKELDQMEDRAKQTKAKLAIKVSDGKLHDR